MMIISKEGKTMKEYEVFESGLYVGTLVLSVEKVKQMTAQAVYVVREVSQ